MGEAKRVFWCKICAFDYTMQRRLENDLNESMDLTDLLQPLITHQRVCKAFHMPLFQNAYFHGVQLPPVYQHDQYYEYRFIVNSVTAPVPGRVVASMDTLRDPNTDWWNAFVMGVTPEPCEPSMPGKLQRKVPQKSQRVGPRFPATPVAVAPEVPPTPSTFASSLGGPSTADPIVFTVPQVPKIKIRKMYVLAKEDVFMSVLEQDIKTED